MGHDSTFTQVQGACRDIVLHVEEHIKVGTVCAVMVVLSGRRSWACHIHMWQCIRLSRAVKVVNLGRKGCFLRSEAGSLGKALTWCCCSDEVVEGHRNSRHSVVGREE